MENNSNKLFGKEEEYIKKILKLSAYKIEIK